MKIVEDLEVLGYGKENYTETQPNRRRFVDFNQGLDIRLVNNSNAKILSDLRVSPVYRFAWDNVSDEKQIREGIKILQDICNHNIKKYNLNCNHLHC